MFDGGEQSLSLANSSFSIVYNLVNNDGESASFSQSVTVGANIANAIEVIKEGLPVSFYIEDL